MDKVRKSFRRAIASEHDPRERAALLDARKRIEAAITAGDTDHARFLSLLHFGVGQVPAQRMA